MAFDKKASAANKNMFVASIVSKKTGKTASWLNITDTLARTVFGEMKVSDITAEQAEAILPAMFENDNFEVHVVDLTTNLEPVPATEF